MLSLSLSLSDAHPHPQCTHISASASGVSWMITEWLLRKKPSVLGLVSGAVSGLVVVTPACGYIDQTGAFFMGVIAGPCCYFSIKIKEKMGFDDALDAFGVHGVGGVVGGILTGFFANKNISGKEEANGLFYGRPKQVYIQLYGIVVVAAYSFVMTLILQKSLDAVLKAVTGIGIRVTEVCLMPLHASWLLPSILGLECQPAKVLGLECLPAPTMYDVTLRMPASTYYV
jgi:ammonia channel protein AmtB